MLSKSNIFSLLAIIITLSCNKKSRLENLDSLILSLDTQVKKEQFLIDLHDLDQDARNPERKHEILKRNDYDINSYEYKEYMDRMWYIDVANFNNIKRYLEIHGYPTFKPKSNKVNSVIRLICMHQSTYQKQLVLFPYLHKAYEDSLISSEGFSFLLNNMHRHKYGKSHPHAITYEENIKQLLEKLALNKTSL